MALVATLEQRGDIVIRTESTATKSGRFYRLADLPRGEPGTEGPRGAVKNPVGDSGEGEGLGPEDRHGVKNSERL